MTFNSPILRGNSRIRPSWLTRVAGAAIRGALGSAATQGVAIAAGLRSKFDWAGVAAAGVVGGVGRWATPAGSSFVRQLAGGAASSIAGAATRSLATGTSFGDNVLAVLPDVIGTTIGNLVAEQIAGLGRPSANPKSRRFAGKSVQEVADIRIQDAAKASGNTETFLSEVGSNAELRSVFVKEAKLIAAARDGGYSLNDPAALIGTLLSSGSGGAGASGGPGDMTVTGDRTFGDAVAKMLVVAQDTLNSYTEGTRDLIGFGLAVLRGGPVGAIGGYALNQAVSGTLSATGLDQQVGKLVTLVGATGFSILSTSSLSEELSTAQTDGGRSTGTLVEAGSTILGISTLRKLSAAKSGPTIIEGVDASTLVRSHSIGGRSSTARVDDIAASMRSNGYVGDPIKVIQRDGRMIIVDGHHRMVAASRTGTPVNVQVVGPESFPMGSGGWQSIDEVIQASQTAGPNRLNRPRR